MSSPYAARVGLSGAARPVGTLLATASIALLILPFFSTFGELLTKAAMAAGFDAWLGQWIAPIEGRLVHGALALIGIQSAYDGSLLYVGTGPGSLALYISWNCVGWQTVLFLLVSMATGLQGEYTLRSRLETVALGVLGIAILNILRITVVAVVAYVFGQLPAVIVHDYGSVIATVAFLMAFWAFAYNVVLERKFDEPSPEQGSNGPAAVATVLS
ncbi:MAG: exosortase/archaeosortase family protein [Chloroflexi bacterium]|nr:MAG: exosortase/archaeosortase family protein [Chloroflexota bacterium]